MVFRSFKYVNAIDHKRPSLVQLTCMYYGFLMNIINLSIDVTVAKEVVEKWVLVVEEGCLVLLEKNCCETRKNSFPKKGISVRCSSLYSDCGQYQGLMEKCFARQLGLRLPACGLPYSLHSAARQQGKSLGDWNNASWSVDKITCTLRWR